jgi:capsular exopolysaccharide synthesis family protein
MDESSIELRRTIDLLRRQAGLIISSVLICFGIAIIALLLLRPVYSATALLRIKTDHNSTFAAEKSPPTPADDNARMGSEVEIIRSDQNLLRVINEQRLADTPEFAARYAVLEAVLAQLGLISQIDPTGPEAQYLVLQNLHKAVTVERRGLTHIISITANAQSPARAAEIANHIARAYIAGQLQTNITSILKAQDALQARANAAAIALTKAQNQLDGFLANFDTVPAQPTNAQPAIISPNTLEGAAVQVAEAYQLQQRAEVARTHYQQMLSRLSEVEAEAAMQLAQAEIVSPAFAPGVPVFPNRLLTLAFAGLSGLGLGIGLAFFTDQYIGGFTSTSQVETVLRLPVLAEIPRVKSGDLPNDAQPADASVIAPLSGFSESIRRLRARIDRTLNRAHPNIGSAKAPGGTIMVCSALPGEGKSTMALALARTYALSGRRTLLIDTDMRRPHLHKLLNLEPKFGLLDFLTENATPGDNATLAAMLTKDKQTGLEILLGAEGSTVPTDQLFAGHRFTNLMQTATRLFDIVILDTPPAGPLVDALYIAPHVDHLAFVLHFAQTSQTQARTALIDLREVMAEHAQTGIVLNQQDNNALAYLSEERELA